MDLPSVPGDQWSPKSLEPATSPLAVHHQPQTQVLREQWVIPSLPTPIAPTQHCTLAPSSSISPPPMSNRFQNEQLALCKLLGSEHRFKRLSTRLTAALYPDTLHQHIHYDPPIMPHKCIICERGFVRKYDLKIHHQIHIREIRKIMTGLVQMSDGHKVVVKL
ncbi:hypothetical protein BC940DRAFT_336154 [Gongronella butleri]|nr:hypothetical protein BC940DRAFT_336154 [Gongronella butleri]